MANPSPDPHPENLTPFKKGDPETVEKGRKGGKKSQEVQAKKRTMREWAKFYGELPIKPGKLKDPKNAQDIKESNQTMDGAVIAAMYAKATKGDTRAATFLAQMKGQTSEEITLHTDPLAVLTEEQIDAVLAAIRTARQPDE